MPLLRKLGSTHKCELDVQSDSCLPALSPKSNYIEILLRECRKSLMISQNNERGRQYFKSKASIVNERRKQIRFGAWFTIHPYSRFAICQEYLMAFTWMVIFFIDPVVAAFCTVNTLSQNKTLYYINLLLDLITLANIPIFFITGYYDVAKRETVLNPKKVARHYLLTYFFIDIIGCIPYMPIISCFFVIKSECYLCTLASVLSFVRLVRFCTMMHCFYALIRTLGISDATYDLLCLCIYTVYIMHWCACLSFLLPRLYQEIIGQLPETSWIVVEKISGNATLHEKYVKSLYCSVSHFFRTSQGKYYAKFFLEQWLFSLVIIVGSFYFFYIIAITLQIIQYIDPSRTKYDEMLNELSAYLMLRKIPVYIRRKVFLYFEKRFQKHYFREEFILSTLSEHLRYELFLHNLRTLIEKVPLFHDLPKSTVGALVGTLKAKLYLPGDVIISVGSPPEFMYFISFGTVALLTINGKEICHLEDGSYFGELPIMCADSCQHKSPISVVALEVTEVYRMNKVELLHYLRHQSKVENRLKVQADELMKRVKKVTDRTEEDELRERNIIRQLHRGYILEHEYGHRK